MAVKVRNLEEEIRSIVVKTNATYTRGRLAGQSEYFEKWCLHVNKDYLNQLRVYERFECAKVRLR